MADEQETSGPSLEPPKLFGRGRKKKPESVASPEPTGSGAPATPPVEPPTATAPAAPAPTPVAEPPVPPAAEPVFTDVVVPPRDAEPATARKQARAVKPTKPPKPPKDPQPLKEPKPRKEPKPPKAARAPRTEPRLNGWIASTLAGIVTGLVLIGLVKLVLAGCGAVRNSDTCGTGLGLVLLAIVFVLGVVAGRFLLTWSGVHDPGSTSFLAVGLTAVVSLLFLIDVLDTWPMLIVIPAICGASMLLSWWVSTTYVDQPPRRPVDSAASDAPAGTESSPSPR